ncbi:DinB family protein [Blastococcus sp. CT_GayMR19]|uniref:DinB family protein n=1 Tax=Blastococcus sp. CT_GayMR19 TaxID=2559608 RepID=UPI0010731EE6|nr:DinB family protein [Blastococcus sp. CT_GayMR19]TFV72583.1 DinB family protein [Blastococcus sp. CT_GayMR19]
MTADPVDLAAISREMDDALARLHALLTAAGPTDLRRTSDGTRWTNEQLLYHMVFGYLVVRTLLPLVHLMGRLPAPVGRGWAALLNSATRPFHAVNYWGSVAGARVFNHTRMGPLADRTIAVLQRRLTEESEAALHRGMPFPSGWDPYFGFLTLAEVYRYPTRHFEHHYRQLTLPDPGPRPGADEPPDLPGRSDR